MTNPRFIHADPRVVDQRRQDQRVIRDAIGQPHVLVAEQWCPCCLAMTPHANLCPACYPITRGSKIGQSKSCPQCRDQWNEDAYRLWCVDCGHEGTPYPTYVQDGKVLLDQPDERALCAACHDPIVGPKETYRGEGPLHPICAQRAAMQAFVFDLLAGAVPADAETRYRH